MTPDRTPTPTSSNRKPRKIPLLRLPRMHHRHLHQIPLLHEENLIQEVPAQETQRVIDDAQPERADLRHVVEVAVEHFVVELSRGFADGSEGVMDDGVGCWWTGIGDGWGEDGGGG
ncbi:hypothetical protein CBS147323_9208 [Aspergillus niger]|nr:hypothetical protein CBS147323_9208 [Aspergillus niger]